MVLGNYGSMAFKMWPLFRDGLFNTGFTVNKSKELIWHQSIQINFIGLVSIQILWTLYIYILRKL